MQQRSFRWQGFVRNVDLSAQVCSHVLHLHGWRHLAVFHRIRRHLWGLLQLQRLNCRFPKCRQPFFFLTLEYGSPPKAGGWTCGSRRPVPVTTQCLARRNPVEVYTLVVQSKRRKLLLMAKSWARKIPTRSSSRFVMEWNPRDMVLVQHLRSHIQD